MYKALMVAILGYAFPRICWFLLSNRLNSRRYIKTVAIIVTEFYGVVALLLVRPNVVLMIAFIFLLQLVILDETFGWMRFLQKRAKVAHNDVHNATMTDDTWDEALIMPLSRELINHYRTDWQQKDFVAISHYSTDRFSYHNRLFFEALNNENREVSYQAETINTDIIIARDTADVEQDRFSLYVTSQYILKLSDLATEEVLLERTGEIDEIFEIDREDKDWKLSGVMQAHEGNSVLSSAFQEFAHRNGYYYNNRSSDLLLPYSDRLSTRDLKDQGHLVLGVARNMLFSIFQMQAETQEYTIATMSLPKKHPHIFIRNRAVDDLNTDLLRRLKVEWPEFDEHFELFVDQDGSEKELMSLLTPDFLKYVQSLEWPISLEILDRKLYLIFASNKTILSLAPEILSEIHRCAIVALATQQ